MRIKLIESDLVEAVVGLGKELFYNSPMEACVVICRSCKPPDRQNKTLLINAVKEVHKERSQSFLQPGHQARILQAYQNFENKSGFSAVVENEVLLAKEGRLSIPLYVEQKVDTSGVDDSQDLATAWATFEDDSINFWTRMNSLTDMLDGIVGEKN